MPTPRSPERLAYILSLYPILESILSFSHRSNIINLAYTCRTLYSTLTTTVGPLCKPFPRCTEDLKPCTLCPIPVCKDCRQDTFELQKQAEQMSDYGYAYGLVLWRTPGLTEEISVLLQQASYKMGYVVIKQRIEHKHFCELCFSKHRPNMDKVVPGERPEWLERSVRNYERAINHEIDLVEARVLPVMDVKWEGVPHADNTCTCSRFNTGCGISPHLVRVENLPMESELVAFVWLPMSVRSGVSGVQAKVPVYVVDMPPEEVETGQLNLLL